MISLVHWELSLFGGDTKTDLNMTPTGAFDRAAMSEKPPADLQSFYQDGTQAKINTEIARLKSFMERGDA